MEDDPYYMRQALAMARQAAEDGEVPVGAVLVDDAGNVLCRTCNAVERGSCALEHAEIRAIRLGSELLGDWRLDRCTLYVTKEPCPMCAGAAVNARVRRIVFGAPDARGGGCGGAVGIPAVQTLLWHPEITGGVLAGEALALLREFFRARR